MRQYLDLLKKIRDEGVDKPNRTGVLTRSLFGYQYRVNLADGYPLLTTKKVYLKSIIYELLWFLRGDTNIQYLAKNGVKIWNEWAYSDYLKKEKLEEKYPRYSDAWAKHLEEFVAKIVADDEFAKKYGELGPVYGKQWVNWETKDGHSINQIKLVLDLIKNDPTSRRLIVSGWNIGEIEQLVRAHHSAPPPCHTLFHFMVVNGKLSCQLYQRSADVFLGVPFNLASYSLFTMMMAQCAGLQPGEFVHTFGDVHIYQNHFAQVDEQLSREPRKLPTIKINPEVKDIFAFKFEDFEVIGYDPHPPIKAPVAV